MTHENYLAVFDWNATLFKDMKATVHATNESLAFFGVAPMSLQEQQETFTFPLIHFYEKVGVSVDEYLKNAEHVGWLFNRKYNALKNDCRLMDGAIEILEWLRAHNVTCIILSNQMQKMLNEDIVRFDIGHYFDSVSGNSDPATIVTGMNKFERLRDFMDTHQFAPEQTFIIGDSHEEPELAKKLNILGISIKGGLTSDERLEHYKKDYLIGSLPELPAILSSEWGLELPKTPLAQPRLSR